MFRFTIRKNVLATTVVAVAGAWCANHGWLSAKMNSQYNKCAELSMEHHYRTGRGQLLIPSRRYIEDVRPYPDWWMVVTQNASERGPR